MVQFLERAARTQWGLMVCVYFISHIPMLMLLQMMSAGAMGGGVSSVSKVCVLAPSARDDADIDYTFAQVPIKDVRVDMNGNCGNMSSTVGPFAVDERIVFACWERP